MRHNLAHLAQNRGCDKKNCCVKNRGFISYYYIILYYISYLILQIWLNHGAQTQIILNNHPQTIIQGDFLGYAIHNMTWPNMAEHYVFIMCVPSFSRFILGKFIWNVLILTAKNSINAF